MQTLPGRGHFEIVESSNAKYEILEIVGEGAYGIVYKCRNVKNGNILAIKKFKDSEEKEFTRKTILREVKILRALKHENIVTLKDGFRRRRRLYLVFEFVQQNLLQVIEQNPLGLDHTVVQVYIYQLLCALNYCHQRDIIHRDIKPENLLVNLPPDTTLKLCDFGFSRSIAEVSGPMTEYVATRWYRAPELLVSCDVYGKEVDLWATGCIMAELIDSNPLFPGDSDLDQLYLVARTLGSLSQEHQDTFLRNQRFFGANMPSVSKSMTLAKRYRGRVNSCSLDFLTKLLNVNPKHRMNAADALSHPYFHNLTNQFSPSKQLKSRNKRIKKFGVKSNHSSTNSLLKNVAPEIFKRTNSQKNLIESHKLKALTNKLPPCAPLPASECNSKPLFHSPSKLTATPKIFSRVNQIQPEKRQTHKNLSRFKDSNRRLLSRNGKRSLVSHNFMHPLGHQVKDKFHNKLHDKKRQKTRIIPNDILKLKQESELPFTNRSKTSKRSKGKSERVSNEDNPPRRKFRSNRESRFGLLPSVLKSSVDAHASENLPGKLMPTRTRLSRLLSKTSGDGRINKKRKNGSKFPLAMGLRK